MRVIFFCLIFLGLSLNTKVVNAQLNKNLLEILPDSIKPKNPAQLTDVELRKILYTCDEKQWRDFPLPADLNSLLPILLNRVSYKEASVNNLENIYAYLTFNDRQRNGLTGEWRYSTLFYKLSSTYVNLSKKIPQDQINTKHLIRAFVNQAIFLEPKANGIELAIKKYNEILTAVPKIKEYPIEYASTYANLSLLFTQIGLHQKSLEHINKALFIHHQATISKEIPKNISYGRFSRFERVFLNYKAFSLFNLYDHNPNPKLLDSAKVLLQTFKQYDKDSIKLDSVGTRFFKANLLIRQGAYQTALANLSTLIQIEFTSGNLLNVGPDQIKPLLVFCLIKEGAFEKAKQISLSHLNGLSEFNIILLACLSEFQKHAEKIGNYKEALFWQKQVIAASNQINVLNNRGLVFEIDQKYDNAQKQKTIAELQNVQQLQESEMQFYIAISVLVLTILGAIALWWYHKSKHQLLIDKLDKERLIAEKRNQEDELLLQKLQFDLEKSKQLLAQRKQISVDVHDDVSGNIAILKYYIDDLMQQAKEEETKKVLVDINEEVVSIYEIVRSFMQRLSNGNNGEKFVLLDVLIDFCAKIEEQHGIKIDLLLDKEETTNNLTEEQQNELMRVIKEALTNSIKYADCTYVKIKISYDKDYCYFEIEDNGIGFNEKDINFGYGINSMKSRLLSLNGKVDLSSGVNQGVKIHGKFPLTT